MIVANQLHNKTAKHKTNSFDNILCESEPEPTGRKLTHRTQVDSIQFLLLSQAEKHDALKELSHY